MTKLILVLLVGVGGWLQLPPTLDLTVPPDTPGSERIRSLTNTGSITISTSVVDLPDREYTVGDPFDYTVELTNTSSSNIAIPWSGSLLNIDEASDDQVLVASIALMIRNASGPDRVLTAATVYGRRDIPSSLLVLAPGASARVRATSTWSVAGVKMQEFLGSSSARVTLRAKYFMQTDGTLYSSQLSPPNGLTLSLRSAL
jgi:hypothetical protein